MTSTVVWRLLLASVMVAPFVSAQNPAAPSQAAMPAPPATEKPATVTVSSDYVLEPDDEITIHSILAKEIADKTFRVDQNGEVNFPLVGVLHLGGKTVRQDEEALTTALAQFYIRPDVEINVTTMHTEPISVLGAVGTPGVYPLKYRTHLLEALSAAGGVRGDAGATVILTRQNAYGPIPLKTARQTLTGESVAEIDLKMLTEAQDSQENILIRPHDVISVPLAQMVYVLGSVKKSGGFVLGGRPNLTVLQALALAEGLDPKASPSNARILRRGDGKEEEVAVDINKMKDGKTEDVVLRPNDILYVPSSTGKAVAMRTLEAAIAVGTGLAIFH